VKDFLIYDGSPCGVAVINGRPGAAGEMAARYRFHEILRNEINAKPKMPEETANCKYPFLFR